MKDFKSIKASGHSVTLKIEKAINALYENVGEGIENAFNRSEETRGRLLMVASKMAKKAEENEKATDAKKEEVRANLDMLKVKLALGKADLETGAKEKRKEISDAIRDFEAQLESDIDLADEELEKEWVEESITFEEEMNALHLEHELEKEEMKEKRDTKIAEIKEKVGSVKQKIKDAKDADVAELKESVERLGETYAEIAQYYPPRM